MSRKTYILDPGHGGINPATGLYVTPGKRSPVWADGTIYYEGDGNRKIAKLVGERLAARGINYQYTVEPDDYTDLSLSQRVRKANTQHLQTGDVVFISIHSNAAASPTAHGFEVFTSPGRTPSDRYAEYMLEALSKTFPALRNRGHKKARFQVLTQTICPAILVESMFHTNEKECRILMSESGRRCIADAIVSAIKKIEENG